jgi:hypothetical protein
MTRLSTNTIKLIIFTKHIGPQQHEFSKHNTIITKILHIELYNNNFMSFLR